MFCEKAIYISWLWLRYAIAATHKTFEIFCCFTVSREVLNIDGKSILNGNIWLKIKRFRGVKLTTIWGHFRVYHRVLNIKGNGIKSYNLPNLKLVGNGCTMYMVVCP